MGSVRAMPIDHFGLPDIITVDLEALYTNVYEKLCAMYVANKVIREAYVGTEDKVTKMIETDCLSYCDFLIAQTYNKLRTVLKKHPSQMVQRMNTSCPVPPNQEFPSWIVSTLSCIGPFRIEDGPRDRYALYASSAATMQFHGRTAPPKFIYGGYYRIHEALKRQGVQMSHFDHMTEKGSFYPTIEFAFEDDVWGVFGTVHSSHYENEDLTRAAFVSTKTGKSPFESIGMRIGYVDDYTTLKALAAVPTPPAHIPTGQNAYSPGSPLGLTFNVNYHGIQSNTSARGAYVIGRGAERYYQCRLAQNMTAADLAVSIPNRVQIPVVPPPAPPTEKLCDICRPRINCKH